MSILYDFSKSLTIEEIGLPVITSGTDNLGGGMYRLRAGTPIGHVSVEEADPEWAIANTDDAECVVLEDYVFISTDPTQPKLVKCVTAGYIDLESAEAASGIEYSDDAKSALETAGIILVDGVLETGGGSGGGGVLTEFYEGALDKTAGELYAAASVGGSIFVQYYGEGGSAWITPMRQVGLAEVDDGVMYIFMFDDNGGNSEILYADSADGYPHAEEA